MPPTRKKVAKIVKEALSSSVAKPTKPVKSTPSKTVEKEVEEAHGSLENLNANQLEAHIVSKGKPERAASSMRFFQTKPGQYGHGDEFCGLSMPEIRVLSKETGILSSDKTTQLLNSPIHEIRMLALVNMTDQVRKKKTDVSTRREIYNTYTQAMKGPRGVNNWDLVDVSAPYIVGDYLHAHEKSPLQILREWIKSENLWIRRVAIVATQGRIREGDFNWILDLAPRVLSDTHDLIHKATGWMLREMGNRDENQLIAFLDKHAAKMPRTMLRYSIEKLDNDQRQQYLNKSS